MMYTFRKEQIDLCGTWGFYPDPCERGIRQEWWRNKRNGLQLFPCYDDYTNTVEVPHTWNAHNEGLKYYEGTCMYLKEFELEEVNAVRLEKEAWLCFDGANYHTEVYLNGEFVGSHDGGYTAFQMNITRCLGRHNRLWVAVNNSRNVDRIPALTYDWWNDGGLYRPVKIIFTPKEYIKDFSVRTDISGNEAILTLGVELGGKDTRHLIPYSVEIEELDILLQGEAWTNRHTYKQIRIPLDKITLWSPESPKLYSITIRTGTDRISDDVGFREIRVSGRDILLNGQPLFLKGINFHDEYKEYGRTPKKELIDEAFAFFKDMGINYIRLAHYPHAEEFIRRADREGMLLWEEIPAYWYMYWERPGFYSTAEKMLLEMIERDKNRASVIIWSVGNEMETKSHHAHYLVKLGEAARKSDPTRLISYACSWFVGNEDGAGGYPGMPDCLYDFLDIVAINNYSGASGHGKPEDLDWIINGYSKFGKPVVMSEFGACSKLGCENGRDDSLSEELHIEIFTRQIKTILDNPHIRGLSPWHFSDIRTPLYHLELSNTYFRYGFLDENWKPKKVYETLKRFYRN